MENECILKVDRDILAGLGVPDGTGQRGSLSRSDVLCKGCVSACWLILVKVWSWGLDMLAVGSCVSARLAGRGIAEG